MAYRTATTPRRTSYFGQLVSDAHLNDANWYTELAERNAHIDAGATGILDGLDVTQHYTGTFAAPDLTVDVSAGVARDDAGWRLPLATLQNVDCSVDYLGAATTVAAGNHRCLSIFARFEDDYSEIHSIKSGGSAYRIHDDSTVLEVWMGTETLLAAPLDQPALAAGYVLLADVTLINGQTQIVTGDISTTRRQDQVVIAGTTHSIRRSWLITAISDLLGWLNTVVGAVAAMQRRVRVTRNAAQTCASGNTAIIFDTEKYDTDGMWVVGTNPERLTATHAGYYHVSASMQIATIAVANYSSLILQHSNGGYTIGENNEGTFPSGARSLSTSGDAYFATGEYCTVRFWHNCAAGVDATYTMASMHCIGET